MANAATADTVPAPVAESNNTANTVGSSAVSGGAGFETLTEKALRASTMRDTASGVLYTLGQLAREFPEVHDALSTSLHKNRLKIPPAPPTHGPARVHVAGGRGGAGSLPGSARSSQSAGSSRSTRSNGDRSDGWANGLGVGERRGVSGGASISPMRVFEAPM